MGRTYIPNPKMRQVIEHIGKYGCSSEQFLIDKFKCSIGQLFELQKNGYAMRHSLDIRHLKAHEGIWILKPKGKRNLVKGEYMRGDPSRNEIPTLLYLQEAMEVIRKKYNIVGEITERTIKGMKAREANIATTAHGFTKGVTPPGAQERAQYFQHQAPDHRIVYRQSPSEPMKTLNIEIHGSYYGVQLKDKIEAFAQEEHPTLWIVPQSRRVTAHVQKFVDLYGNGKIEVKFMDDLEELQP